MRRGGWLAWGVGAAVLTGVAWHALSPETPGPGGSAAREDGPRSRLASRGASDGAASPPPATLEVDTDGLRAEPEAPLPPADPDVPEAADPAEPPRVLYLHDIEDIKHEIYEREIESVDRLHLLDELVQTGDMDTRELWDSDWSGVDDWKREQNGFTLQRDENGLLVFHPDQATMDLYSFTEAVELYDYDPYRHEFVSEVDYYGKPILKVLKFIKEDALVMMVISGDKVDLNIYDKGAPPE
jgi:hypothetical protein